MWLLMHSHEIEIHISLYEWLGYVFCLDGTNVCDMNVLCL